MLVPLVCSARVGVCVGVAVVERGFARGAWKELYQWAGRLKEVD